MTAALDIRGPAIVTNYVCILHPDKSANGIRCRVSSDYNGPGGIYSVLQGIQVDMGGQPSSPSIGFGRKGIVLSDKYISLTGFTVKNGWSGNANTDGTLGLQIGIGGQFCKVANGTLLDQCHGVQLNDQSNTFINVRAVGQSGLNVTPFVPLGEGFYCIYDATDPANIRDASYNQFINCQASGFQRGFRTNATTLANKFINCDATGNVTAPVVLSGTYEVWNCPSFGLSYNVYAGAAYPAMEISYNASNTSWARLRGTSGDVFIDARTAAGTENVNVQVKGQGNGGGELVSGNGSRQARANNTGVGFCGTAPIAKPTITGSKGANAALTSLLTALANYGLVTDSTT